jgi:hypothetical protein
MEKVEEGGSKDGFRNLGLSDLKKLYYIYMMSDYLFFVSTMSKPVR